LIKNILLSALIALLFSACSTKEVFEPKQLSYDWDMYEDTDEVFLDTSSNIALLEDNKVLTKKGIVDINISSEDRLISQSDSWIISTTIDGKMTLVSVDDTSIVKHIDLKKTVAGASVEGDTLAILFADNEIALYNMKTESFIFKEQGGKSLAVNSRIVNPFFMRGLVLFATLDGKIIFVNTKLNKRLRTVIVSSADNFNNVISLGLVNNKIIAATSYEILAIAKKEIRAKYELREIILGKDSIFIATKQGEVISLTPELQVKFKVKFPFAHFYAMTSDEDNLYILEKEGYMISIDKKTFDYSVHEVDFDGGFVFVADKTFYIDDKKILTK